VVVATPIRHGTFARCPCSTALPLCSTGQEQIGSRALLFTPFWRGRKQAICRNPCFPSN
jgi:hypothetical protein